MAASGALPGCFSLCYRIARIPISLQDQKFFSSRGYHHFEQSAVGSLRAYSPQSSQFGITGWGHMSEPRANVLHTQSAHCGDYTQSWMMNSVTTELSTVHQQYPAELEVLGSSNCDFVSGSRTILGQEHLTSGAGRTDTYSSFNRTDQAGKDEEKRGLDPNNPVSNWLRGSSTRKKRCPYIKHQILEPEKTFLFNMGPRSHRETGLNLVPKPQDESKKQKKACAEDDYTRSDLIHLKPGGLFKI